MQTALRLYGEVDRDAALQLLDTDIGQRAMTDLRHQLRELYDAEAERLAAARESSERDLQTSRVLLGAASFLSLRARRAVGALLAPRHAPAREGGRGSRRPQSRARPHGAAAHGHAVPPVEQPAESRGAREGRPRPRAARRARRPPGRDQDRHLLAQEAGRRRLGGEPAALGTRAALPGRGPCAQAPGHREPAPDAARQRRPGRGAALARGRDAAPPGHRLRGAVPGEPCRNCRRMPGSPSSARSRSAS